MGAGGGAGGTGWEWKAGAGWLPFSVDSAAEIEEAYQCKRRSVLVYEGASMLEIDIAGLARRDMDTGEVFAVRRRG